MWSGSFSLPSSRLQRLQRRPPQLRLLSSQRRTTRRRLCQSGPPETNSPLAVPGAAQGTGRPMASARPGGADAALTGGGHVFRPLIALIFVLVSLPAGATNSPCSGKKGGISHCRGAMFVCQDSSTSASKQDCRTYEGGRYDTDDSDPPAPRVPTPQTRGVGQ